MINKTLKKTFLALIAVILLSSLGYCEDIQGVLDQAGNIYAGSEATNNLIAGFSTGGLIGGLLFGSIGLVAFLYGKKNSEFRPMIMGILLMGYPYFLKNTIALYLVGVALTVILFIWRE